MNYLEPITDYHELNWRLSKHFNIPMCQIIYSRRDNERGTYSYKRMKIAPNALLWVFTHEYAHHLDRMKNGKRCEAHSEIFYWHLRAVIKNIEPVGYPWYKEYKQLQRWAIRDKLLWIYEE